VAGHAQKIISAVALGVVPLALVGIACNPSSSERPEPAERNERWATTDNTSVAIDWDRLNEAYKLAEGPEDLERRVNEIYEGDEIISISVADVDDRTQLVTGFIDRNTSGSVDDTEKIFAIRREVTGKDTAQYQTVGHGPYNGYYSPMFGIASGMLLGSMMSRSFMPGYAPMYRQPYTTPATRVGEMRQTRSSYRAANPTQFQKSQSGRTYNRPSTARGAPRFRGGGRFGVATKGRARRLDA
jgi:hypothetical protein